MTSAAPVTLWCLPNAGASAAAYAGWRRTAPEGLRIAPLELPGRGARGGEALLEDFDTLCDDVQRALQAQRAGEPYALFGHSMGALLAFELAHRLEHAGDPPRALFVAGSPAPALRDPDRFAGPFDDAALLAQMRALGGTPQILLDHPEMMALALPVLRADFRACSRYTRRERPPLTMPVHAFGGRADAAVGESIAGWADETVGATSLTWYDGGHFFVQDAAPHMLARIAGALGAAVAPRACASC